jgi:hypothetical protein
MDGACILYPLRVPPRDGRPEGVSGEHRWPFGYDGSFDLVGAPWTSVASARPVLWTAGFCVPSGRTRRVRWDGHVAGWHGWEDFRPSYGARPDLGGGAVLTLCHPLDYLWLPLGALASSQDGRLVGLSDGWTL